MDHIHVHIYFMTRKHQHSQMYIQAQVVNFVPVYTQLLKLLSA